MGNLRIKLKEVVILFRVKHYVKNVLIFFPLIFAGGFLEFSSLLCCVKGFVVFSFLTSAIYILNDICDVDNDRNHPIKKNRPLASGKISLNLGKFLCFMSAFFSFSLLAWMVSVEKCSLVSIFYTVLYLSLNIAYSFGFKNFPVLDVVILMLGFLIRILFGAALVGVSVSIWLYLTVISGAFYLAFGKRRNELRIKNGMNTRKVLDSYTFSFLDKFMYLTLTMSLIFYSLWAKETENKFLIVSIPIVIVIFMEYSRNIEKDSDGDPVEVVLKNKVLLILCFMEFAIITGALYVL